MRKRLLLIQFLVILLSCNNNKKREVPSQSIVNIEKLVLQADIYYSNNNYTKSIELFDRIISLDSTRGKIYFQRGYCNAQLLDYERSNNDYKKSVELGYRVDDSYFCLGCNYASTHNDSLALIFFSRAYSLNSKNISAKREMDRIKQRSE